MGFFYTRPNPAVSTVQEKRMQEIKNCHSQDSKHQRDATAWGMKQYLSSSRCAFSAAFHQHLQHHFRTGAPAPGDAVLSSSSLPLHPWPCPQLCATEDSRARSVRRSQPQQGLCPQFFTFSLSQLNIPSSAFAGVCQRLRVLSCAQSIREMRNAVLPQASRTNPFFSQNGRWQHFPNGK